MRPSSSLSPLWLASLLLVACTDPLAPADASTGGPGSETSVGSSADAAESETETETEDEPITSSAEASTTAAETSFTVTVDGGHGGGAFAPGAEVHIWSGHDPGHARLVAWMTDDAELEDPGEWHTRFVMPEHDVHLTAELEPVDLEFAIDTYAGRDREKTMRWFAPPDAVGIMLMFHGTGGSSALVERTEARSLAMAAAARGLAVVATDAEEVDAGDQPPLDGKIRWDASLHPDNVDVANIERLRLELEAMGIVPPGVPFFAMGMSNGGAFALSLGAALPLDAVVSYCAQGNAAAATLTTTPSAWLLCGNDQHEQVDNELAAQRHAVLVERGIPTALHLHPPSPLYPQRVARVDGLDAALSVALPDELGSAAAVDPAGWVVVSSAELGAMVEADPEAFATLDQLPPGTLPGYLAQVQIMMAEHKLYDDYAQRMLDFFEAHARMAG